jgi:hypothetical protein
LRSAAGFSWDIADRSLPGLSFIAEPIEVGCMKKPDGSLRLWVQNLSPSSLMKL